MIIENGSRIGLSLFGKRKRQTGWKLTNLNRKGKEKMKQTKRVVLVFVAISIMMMIIGTAYAQDTAKININKATIEELMKLEKVGGKYAQRIVEYREKNGPFKAPEDIMEVKGIGTKIWELNKNVITIK